MSDHSSTKLSSPLVDTHRFLKAGPMLEAMTLRLVGDGGGGGDSKEKGKNQRQNINKM